ncbi:MAG: flagellar biosynthesis anti-sigma factor FlgM [Bacillota bacterium]
MSRVVSSTGATPMERAEKPRHCSSVQASARSSAEKLDTVRLYTQTEEFRKAVEAVKRAPEVRQDKVEELRKAIVSGTYQVDSMAVAEKMLCRIFVDYMLGSGMKK